MKKWVGLIQAFNELPENLPRAVASMRRICDKVVGYDDGSTDGSTAWMSDHLDKVFIGSVNDWKSELQHKSQMLEWARAEGCDWVLWLDADEELSPPAVAALRRLEDRDDLTGICVPEINLWRSKESYRVDSQFGDAGFLRCWRMCHRLRYEPSGPGLHQQQFPPTARESMTSLRYPDEPIIHYSWDSPEKIVAKHARYAAMGQCGPSLDRLLDVPNAVLVPVKPEWFWNQ